MMLQTKQARLPRAVLIACALLGVSLPLAGPADANALITPRLHLSPAASAVPRVALTLDACSGQTDDRILKALVSNHVKATIFATARWLRRNPVAIAEIKAHPELFRVENHGANHLAAVLTPGRVYGVRTAGSLSGLKAEIADGASAVTAATGRKPQWFRGATAEYSADALKEITAMGERVAGFSVLGDGGALFSSSHAAKVIGAARDGDVIIAHINQPRKPAGLGVVNGILALQARGVKFVWLDDAEKGAVPKTVSSN